MINGQLQVPRQFVPPKLGEAIKCNDTNYFIGQVLGHGNFGVVYECSDEWNNRLVAKVLSPNNKPYEQVRYEWEKELNHLKNLRHPNITFMHQAFEYRDTFYIIVERCEITLMQLISQYGFNGNIWFPYIARDILHGLDFIHSHGYVHKDLHMENIFVSNQYDLMAPHKAPVWSFKIADFGITNLEGFVRQPNTLLAQWMLAPEVLNSQSFGLVGRTMDIYHVALMLLQVLVGKPLDFSNADVLEGLPRQTAESLNSPYSYALSRALRRHVNARTSSAIEMWRDIKRSIPSQYL
ncbi:protein kinase [Vibrio sp. CCB-PB317]|uniref:protein kinase domain-containing protein n=1 Tax=Vibrio sp. CCB-PB317 TaxID=2929171 RepID=UPI001FAE010F|nr:protein kinase [Vibrio sp. CCB-PB317]MCJ0884307.1 protein kinase [Vibrio sp. CCB-PB317]